MKTILKLSVLLFAFSISTLHAQDDALKITEDGNVGINTSNPTEKLEVKGNIKASGNIETTGNVKIDGTLEVKNSLNYFYAATIKNNPKSVFTEDEIDKVNLYWDAPTTTDNITVWVNDNEIGIKEKDMSNINIPLNYLTAENPNYCNIRFKESTGKTHFSNYTFNIAQKTINDFFFKYKTFDDQIIAERNTVWSFQFRKSKLYMKFENTINPSNISIKINGKEQNVKVEKETDTDTKYFINFEKYPFIHRNFNEGANTITIYETINGLTLFKENFKFNYKSKWKYGMNVPYSTHYLKPETRLYNNEVMTSPNGKYLLQLNNEAVFEVYNTKSGELIWKSKGPTGNHKVIFNNYKNKPHKLFLKSQNDGNIVIYIQTEKNGEHPIWTITDENKRRHVEVFAYRELYGEVGHYFMLKNDGNVVIIKQKKNSTLNDDHTYSHSLFDSDDYRHGKFYNLRDELIWYACKDVEKKITEEVNGYPRKVITIGKKIIRKCSNN